MFTVCLNNARFSLFIFAFTHCDATHSFVLSIFALFQYVIHVMIFYKCQLTISWVSFLGYSKGFIVISHILFSMFEINVYSIIDSKVFGVTIGVNFFLPIVK